jgi:hypothetical protein
MSKRYETVATLFVPNYVYILAYNVFVILKMNVDGDRCAKPLIKQRKQFVETLGKHLVQPNIDRRRERTECDGRGYQSSVIRANEACGEKVQKRRRSSNCEETEPKRGLVASVLETITNIPRSAKFVSCFCARITVPARQQ